MCLNIPPSRYKHLKKVRNHTYTIDPTVFVVESEAVNMESIISGWFVISI